MVRSASLHSRLSLLASGQRRNLTDPGRCWPPRSRPHFGAHSLLSTDRTAGGRFRGRASAATRAERDVLKVRRRRSSRLPTFRWRPSLRARANSTTPPWKQAARRPRRRLESNSAAWWKVRLRTCWREAAPRKQSELDAKVDWPPRRERDSGRGPRARRQSPRSPPAPPINQFFRPRKRGGWWRKLSKSPPFPWPPQEGRRQ